MWLIYTQWTVFMFWHNRDKKKVQLWKYLYHFGHTTRNREYVRGILQAPFHTIPHADQLVDSVLFGFDHLWKSGMIIVMAPKNERDFD